MAAHRFTTLLAATAVLLTSASAEARFGKRSGSSSGSSSRSGSSGSSSGGSSSGSHHAEPVSTPQSNNGGETSRRDGGEGRSYPAYRSYGYYGGGYGYYGGYYGGYYPYFASYPAPPPPSEPELTATTGAAGQVHSGGAALGLNLAVEGERVGFNTTFTNILVGADDGSGGVDSIKLWNFYLSYAVLAGPHGRLRVEGGGASAFAPDVAMLGPSLGMSAALGLIGSLGVEASAHVTPVPFRELDLLAGLTLGLGPIDLRGGYRHVALDDRGVVDGVVHTDLFAGPYLGLGISF